eukprot:jgi/Ulvmu1/7110/UM034_0016.1
MVLRAYVQAAVSLCRREHSVVSIAGYVSQSLQGACTHSDNWHWYSNIHLSKLWSEPVSVHAQSNDVLLTSSAGDLRTRRSAGLPLISVRGSSYRIPYQRACNRRQASTAVVTENVDEGPPQAWPAEAWRQMRQQEHEPVSESGDFIVPVASGHHEVRRSRWKRKKWLMRVRALHHLDNARSAQGEHSDQAGHGSTSNTQLSDYLLDCVHELRRVSAARAGYSDMWMLDHVQLLVEHFPRVDTGTQRSLLRLLGSALAQQRHHRLWLALGHHSGATHAVRIAALPHVAAWRASGCPHLWTLLARVHCRLLWRDARFFEETLTVAHIETMSAYTACVALSVAVRSRPVLPPEAWQALLRRVAGTVADMHDEGAREVFRMLAHLQPSGDACEALPAGTHTSRPRGLSTAAGEPWQHHGAAAGSLDLAAAASAEPAADAVRSGHSTDGTEHAGAAAAAATTGGELADGVGGCHPEPRAAAGEPQSVAGQAQHGGPADRDCFSEELSEEWVVAAPGAAADAHPESPEQALFDQFFRGHAHADAAATRHPLDAWAHAAPQHTAREGGDLVPGAGGAPQRKVHSRVWQPDALPVFPWLAARAAAQRRLQLSVRDAAMLRRHVLRESAHDLQLNAWERRRMTARLLAADRKAWER